MRKSSIFLIPILVILSLAEEIPVFDLCCGMESSGLSPLDIVLILSSRIIAASSGVLPVMSIKSSNSLLVGGFSVAILFSLASLKDCWNLLESQRQKNNL